MTQHAPARPISPAAAAVFSVALAALLVIALFPVFPRQFDVRVGDIASATIRAPKSVSFESASRTEERREAAAAAVPPSLEYDAEVQSRQLSAYDNAANQARQARGLADDERKREALADLQLSPRSADTVIGLDDERFDAVVNEGRRVLEETLAISLDEPGVAREKDGLNTRIGAEFTANEALVIAELARPLIVPTLRVNEARTEENRAEARSSIPPELVSVQEDEVILDRGSVVEEVDLEKLRATGLLTRNVEWRNVMAVALIAAMAGGLLGGYLLVLQPNGITSERHLIALAVVTALPVLVAKLYLSLGIVFPDTDRQFLAYILPVAAAPILIAALLNTEVAVIVAAIEGALIALVTALMPDASLFASISILDTMRLLLVYSIPPVAGVYLVHQADRLNRYMTAGLAVSAAAFTMLLATWLMDAEREAADIAWIALVSGISGVSSGVLAAGAFVTVGVLFGVTTRLQLMELSQLNAPLLRRLQDEAPGTFHHSVIVGNLAERAADLIGADALLTRVGCYYHDIGKVLQPGLYIENQMGDSPHEGMSPQESAEAIKQHVVGGLELARRSRLPAHVQEFIPEHHGTRLVAYFYRKAAEDDPEADPADYQYPGPRPQTRETAIVMLADSTEAVIRSSADRSPERIDQLVDEVIAERLSEGQLDESDLTLKDLRTIAESFKGTMRAVYHPRVQYPKPTAVEARRRVLRLPLRGITPPGPVRPEPRRRGRG